MRRLFVGAFFNLRRYFMDNELFKEMYFKLFNEITNVETDMENIAQKLKKLQCELEEFYINKVKTDM